MSIKKYKEIHLRFSDEDYTALTSLANEQGCSNARLCRKIIHEYLSVDNANKGLDSIINAVRLNSKNLEYKMLELQQLENRILSATTLNRFLDLALLKHSTSLIPEDIKEIYNTARKDSYIFLKNNLEKNDNILDDFFKED